MTDARPLTTLTGFKPTGELHLGNYLAAIRPVVASAQRSDRRVIVFIADLHALNQLREPALVRKYTRQLAAALLACGLDTENTLLFRQSDVPAIPQLAQLLTNVTAKGLMNRAHAYKASVAANEQAGREPDHGVNMGLFNYPILMAADILAFGADQVPVGRDQAQHLEIAVDIAQAFARIYKPGVLREPELVLQDDVATLPGLDGRKMSKSYENTIPLFEPENQLRAKVKRIVTDSRQPEEPKDPTDCTVAQLLRLFGRPEAITVVESGYRAGGMGYGDAKRILADELVHYLTPLRERYEALLADPKQLDAVLATGAAAASQRANRTLSKAMRAVGLR